MPRLCKLVFRGLFNTVAAARSGHPLSSPGSFPVRRAMATLLGLMPGASSHYFITFVPDQDR
jgi:hypothetical protein